MPNVLLRCWNTLRVVLAQRERVSTARALEQSSVPAFFTGLVVGVQLPHHVGAVQAKGVVAEVGNLVLARLWEDASHC